MKIEAGKCYRTRDGQKYGPAKKTTGDEQPWLLRENGDGLAIRVGYDGAFWPSKTLSGYDLVAEWVDDPSDARDGPVRTVIQTPEDYKDYQADKLLHDVMQQRAKMAITHSNAKLEQKWREHVREEGE